MSRFYKIRIIGSIMVLERKTFPRVRVFISLKKNLPEIVRISLLEDCSGAEVAQVLRMINYFLNHFSFDDLPVNRTGRGFDLSREFL
jgi:hypothetical protein